MANAVFNEFTDMDQWDLTDLQDADTPVHSATKIVLVVPNDPGDPDTVWTLSGTGFTYDGENVSGGTLKRITIKDDGAATFSADVSGLAIPIVDMKAFVDENNVAGFQNALFSGNDNFTLNSTDSYNLRGLGGNDKFYFGANLSSDDRADGGDGTDTMYLNGNYGAGLFFNATTMTHFEKMQLANGFSYFLSFDDATIGAGETLTVNGAKLDGTQFVNLDASHETNGKVKFTGGAGADGLFGGAGNDQLTGKGGSDFIKGDAGADKLNGGGGLDYFVYHHEGSNLEGLQSNSTAYDTIFDFDAAEDLIDVANKPITYDGTIGAPDLKHLNGTLTAGNFAVDHARVVTMANNGDMFVVVNSDGVAGYQAGSDLVMRLDTPHHMGSFSSATFVVFG